MKALVLFATFVVLGLAVSTGIGYYVERLTSSTVSLFVFLILFFANFAVAWTATVLVMDGSLRGSKQSLRAEPSAVRA
jgi:hypothetical protein